MFMNDDETRLRFQADPKQLVGHWVAKHTVQGETNGAPVIYRYPRPVFEVASVGRETATLFIVRALREGLAPFKIDEPLSALFDKEGVFYDVFEYLGPRETFDWIRPDVIVRQRVSEGTDPFYAQIVEVTGSVEIEYRPSGDNALLPTYPYARPQADRYNGLLEADDPTGILFVRSPSRALFWLRNFPLLWERVGSHRERYRGGLETGRGGQHHARQPHDRHTRA